MNDKELKKILQETRVIASVGLSGNPERDSYEVGQFLMRRGYEVIPVNPTADMIQGKKSYPDLLQVPKKVDVVQIFRKPQDIPPVVEQAIQIGAKVVWMQLGIVNEEAAARAREAGLQVVMDRCMMKEYKRLILGKPEA